LPNSSGSLAMLAAMGRVSSRVILTVAAVRPERLLRRSPAIVLPRRG
jgi:hypothetical protein